MKLGCSEIDITPNIPVHMGGYGARKLPGNGVATNLFARGFVFAHGDVMTGLITADILMLNREQVEMIQAEASRLTGIPEQQIIVACSHTHSGPATFSRAGLGNPPDPEYINWLLKALAGSLLMAKENLEPVRAGSATTSVQGIGANRRQAEATMDTQLTVVGFEDAAGNLKALLFNFPCHPTVLGADNLLVSAEYPGAAASLIKKIYPRTTVGFINGACGDISTRFVRRGQNHAEVERLGMILGAHVVALSAELEFADADLAVTVQTLPATLKPPVSKQDSEAELAQWKQRLDELMAQGATAAELRQAQTGMEGAMVQMQRAQIQDQLETEAELVAWRLGGIGLVTVPGELFSALGQRIEDNSPFRHNIIAGYSNGYLGYIPDSIAYEQGGYETLSSPLAQGFGEKLADAAAAILTGLSKQEQEG
ncbi:MAG: hypothetical protein FH749_03510 [Firmicutes bacterium]|nr:hypothetical protein [Bacillota bacterium]